MPSVEDDKKIAAAADSGPCVWSNRVIVAMVGDVVKVVFLEQSSEDGPIMFRAGTAFSRKNASDLRDLLAKMLA